MHFTLQRASAPRPTHLRVGPSRTAVAVAAPVRPQHGLQISNGASVCMIRHGLKKAELGLPADQRKALIRNLVTEVLRHGRITTTRDISMISLRSRKFRSRAVEELRELLWANTLLQLIFQVRAKAIRKYVDKMITLAKRGDLHAQRQAFGFVYDKSIVYALFKEAPARYGERNGGYCRVKPVVQRRRGDSAEMAIIELV